jgi:hypothetical protein
MEMNVEYSPAGFTMLIMRFLIRNLLAEAGTRGDEAMDDGPGPACADMIYVGGVAIAKGYYSLTD